MTLKVLLIDYFLLEMSSGASLPRWFLGTSTPISNFLIGRSTRIL